MTVAEYIAARLADLGVRFVFGIPGGPSIPYMEAFRDAGIQFILTSNEASAGIMADVTARITGIPGVCHATFGPGATNISTGVGGALLDRSPMLVFTSEVPDNMLHRTTQMRIDHQKLFSPITKATFRMTPSNTGEVMSSAIRICKESYPGPVHIGLPSDIWDKEAEISSEGFTTEEKIFSNDLTRITELLENAHHPLLAIGLTASRLGIRKELLELLDHYQMPVVLTPMAKGLIPEDHPCYAGVLFHSLSDYLEDIYEITDLVIGLGYDQVEFNYESWKPDVPLVHFDEKETDLPTGDNIIHYYGPVTEWFGMLNKLDRGRMIFNRSLVRGVRDEMLSVFEGFTNHFGPAAAIQVLSNELPRDVILTADVGSHLHVLGQFWNTPGRNRFLMTNGWSGMGFGIPAALGAQISSPGSTVVCITGDGGFLMTAGELITAKRYGLPVIIIVFSDGELNLIKIKQSWKDLPPYATILYQGDMFEADRFLGVKVLTADSSDSLKTAVIEALSVNEPVIINAIIDPEDYKWLIVKR